MTILENKSLEVFLDTYRQQIPSYMINQELINYEKVDKLKKIYDRNELIGFFVVDEEKMKSLFIREESRHLSRQILPAVYTWAKLLSPGWLTLAVDPNNPKTTKLAMLNGFSRTGRMVQGKDRQLEIWEWSKSSDEILLNKEKARQIPELANNKKR